MSSVSPTRQTGNAGEPLPSVLQSKSHSKKETKLPTPCPPKTPPNPVSLKRNKMLRVRKSTDNSYVYPTREELDGSCRCISKKLGKLQTLEERNRQRYNEVKRAGKLAGLPPASEDDICSVQTTAGNGSSFMTESGLGFGVTSFLEENVGPETTSVVNLPSLSHDSMATTLKTLETSSFTLYEDVDPDKIEYTPEEIRCNDMMMKMEGQALEEAKEKAIDAHSKALLTRADLTDSIRDMENELTTLTADIKTAHQTNTSMIAMERTANDILEDIQMKKQAAKLRKAVQKEEEAKTSKELPKPQLQTANVSTQTLVLKPQYMDRGDGMEMEMEMNQNTNAGLMPETTYVPPNRRLKRKPSPLSMHSLRAPQSGSGNAVDQQNMSIYLASEQKKVKCELLSKLNLYVDILETMAEANYKRPERKQLLEKVQRFLPMLSEYEVAPEIKAEMGNQKSEAAQKTAEDEDTEDTTTDSDASVDTSAWGTVAEDTRAAEDTASGDAESEIIQDMTTTVSNSRSAQDICTAANTSENTKIITEDRAVVDPDSTAFQETAPVVQDIVVPNSEAAQDSALCDTGDEAIQDTVAADLDSKADKDTETQVVQDKSADQENTEESASEVIDNVSAYLDSEATQDMEMDDVTNEAKAADLAATSTETGETVNEIIQETTADLDSRDPQDLAKNTVAQATPVADTETSDTLQDKQDDQDSEAAMDTELNKSENKVIQDMAGDLESEAVQIKESENKETQDTDSAIVIQSTTADNVTPQKSDVEKELVQDMAVNKNGEAPQNNETDDTANTVILDIVTDLDREAAQNTETANEVEVSDMESEADQDIETANEGTKADLGSEVAQVTESENRDLQDTAAKLDNKAAEDTELSHSDNEAIQETEADLDSNENKDIENTAADLESEENKDIENTAADLDSEENKDIENTAADLESEASQGNKATESENKGIHGTAAKNIDKKAAQDTEMGYSENEATQEKVADLDSKEDNDIQDKAADLDTKDIQDTVVDQESNAAQDTETDDVDVKPVQDTVKDDEDTEQGDSKNELTQDIALTDSGNVRVAIQDIPMSNTAARDTDHDTKEAVSDATEVEGVQDTATAPDTEAINDTPSVNPNSEDTQDTTSDEKIAATQSTLNDTENKDTIAAEADMEAVSDGAKDEAVSDGEKDDIQDNMNNAVENTDSAKVTRATDIENEAVQSISSANSNDKSVQDSDTESKLDSGAAQSAALDETENNDTTATADIGTGAEKLQDSTHKGIKKSEPTNATSDEGRETVEDTPPANYKNEGVQNSNTENEAIHVQDIVSAEPSAVFEATTSSKIINQDTTAVTESEIAQGTTTSAANVMLRGTVSNDAVNKVQATIKTAPASVSSTPQIKANTTHVSQPTRVFRKFSRALMKSHTSSGLKQVGSFLLPKKSVSKSLPTFLKKTTPEKQDKSSDMIVTNTQVTVATPRIRSEERATTNSDAGTNNKPRRMSLF